MRRQELLAARYDHRTAAEKLIKAARETGKDLAGAALKEFEAHVAEIRKIDDQLDRIEADGGTFQRDLGMPGQAPEGVLITNQPVNRPVIVGPNGMLAGQGEGWSDPRSGRPIRVLKPEERFSDLEAHAGPPLSIGGALRGIVTGKWATPELQAAMQESSLGGGGYLLPSPLSDVIIDKVRNLAAVIRAGALSVPMESSTLAMGRVATDPTAGWHSELAAITASDMGFEKVTFTAQTLAALAVLSVEIFEDVGNLDQLVINAISKVLALELDRASLRGSGTAPEPRGIRNQSNVTVDSTTFTANGSVISGTTPTGAVAWDWLAKQISALWGVNENPNAVIYSARTAGELDLLRASTGEVLGPPASVAALQRIFTNQIPNNLTQGTQNDCSEAYVGDFTAAMVGMRREVVVEVSRSANVGTDSMFSKLGVGIRAYLRGDFQLARPGAFRVVTGIR